MRIEQTFWTETGQWQPHSPGGIEGVQLVLHHGGRDLRHPRP